MDNVRREKHVVSIMIPASGNGCDQRQEGQSSSPEPKAKAQTDGRTPSKSSGSWGESASGTGDVAKNAESDMWRLMGSKAKKSKKSGCERISGLIKGVYARVSCVSRFSSEKIHSAERKEMWHQITPSNAPRARWYHSKTRERKGPSRGVVHKCEPHERNPCAPRFEETTHDETVHQEKRARRTWRRVSLKLKKMLIKLRFLALLLKPGQRWRPLQHHRRNENSWLILEHQCTCWARGFKVRRIGDSAEIQKPHNGGNDHWRSANKRGSTRTRSQTWCLRDGANIRWHACSSITGKLC